MSQLNESSVEYTYDGGRHVGFLVGDETANGPGVLLIHDAMGVSEPMKDAARAIAAQGFRVFLADLWGDGQTPLGEDQIGPLIGRLVGDRSRWTGLLTAGHEQLSAAGVAGPVMIAGYCFGGASALEYVRCGGQVAGAVSIHGGLDLVSLDWSGANAGASVLVLTGAEDPMAAPPVLSALQDVMTGAGVPWEVSLYGHAKHAFTNPQADKAGRPDVLAYDPVAARRSQAAFNRFLAEIVEGAHV